MPVSVTFVDFSPDCECATASSQALQSSCGAEGLWTSAEAANCQQMSTLSQGNSLPCVPLSLTRLLLHSIKSHCHFQLWISLEFAILSISLFLIATPCEVFNVSITPYFYCRTLDLVNLVGNRICWAVKDVLKMNGPSICSSQWEEAPPGSVVLEKI